MKRFISKIKLRIKKSKPVPHERDKFYNFREPLFTSISNREYQNSVAKKMQELDFLGLEISPRPKWERLIATCEFQELENLLSLLVKNGFEVIIGERDFFYFVGRREMAQTRNTREAGLVLVVQKSGREDGENTESPSDKSFQNIPVLSINAELRLKIESYKFPIDAVYLWVDGSDSSWIDKFNRAKKDHDMREGHGTDKSRFFSCNEIEHSINSLRKNAPWINKIFIVTDNQNPNVAENFNNTKIIDHSEIIPREFLPTFNSNVISLYLNNIPGLSNHFLYLNDDIFLGKTTEPSYFFDTNGLSKIRLTRTRIPLETSKKRNVLHEARGNTIKVAADHNLVTSDRSICHGPHAMRIDVLKKIHEEFEFEIKAASRNCFRSRNDIVIEWLYFFFSYTKGVSTYETATDFAYINVNSKGQDGDISRVLRRKLPRIFSLNQVAELPVHLRASEEEIIEKLSKVWKRLNDSKLSEDFD